MPPAPTDPSAAHDCSGLLSTRPATPFPAGDTIGAKATLICALLSTSTAGSGGVHASSAPTSSRSVPFRCAGCSDWAGCCCCADDGIKVMGCAPAAPVFSEEPGAAERMAAAPCSALSSGRCVLGPSASSCPASVPALRLAPTEALGEGTPAPACAAGPCKAPPPASVRPEISALSANTSSDTGACTFSASAGPSPATAKGAAAAPAAGCSRPSVPGCSACPAPGSPCSAPLAAPCSLGPASVLVASSPCRDAVLRPDVPLLGAGWVAAS
mmetsp:Transcript_30100/g.66724  ORF Transcript_30100/g.66724 Transcript_30100/m.66724 type:complete len:270 (-) Transcript_30100:678-1487(-)